MWRTRTVESWFTEWRRVLEEKKQTEERAKTGTHMARAREILIESLHHCEWACSVYLTHGHNRKWFHKFPSCTSSPRSRCFENTSLDKDDDVRGEWIIMSIKLNSWMTNSRGSSMHSSRATLLRILCVSSPFGIKVRHLHQHDAQFTCSSSKIQSTAWDHLVICLATIVSSIFCHSNSSLSSLIQLMWCFFLSPQRNRPGRLVLQSLVRQHLHD